MHGLHLTADLSGCAAGSAALTDAGRLRALCLDAVRAAGLAAVADLFHPFPPRGEAGVTGAVLLAESHVAIHTWPEIGAVTLDVYVCNRGRDNAARAEALMRTLAGGFGATSVERHRLVRGRAAAFAGR